VPAEVLGADEETTLLNMLDSHFSPRRLGLPPGPLLGDFRGIPRADELLLWTAHSEVPFLLRVDGSQGAVAAPGPSGPERRQGRGAALCAVLFIKPQLGIGLMTQVDATVDDASGLLSSYGTALTQGTAVNLTSQTRGLRWLTATRVEGMGTLLYDPTQRSAVKTAWMRKGFTDEQLDTIHKNLTRPGLNPNALLQLLSVGGAMNSTPRTATASAHSDSVMFAEFEAFWPDAADDDTNIAWLRDIYHGTFAAPGGYPVPRQAVRRQLHQQSGPGHHRPDLQQVGRALVHAVLR
jgi:hypothetical protein